MVVDTLALLDSSSRMGTKPAKVQVRVGRNIRNFRRLRGWSQEQLAERVDRAAKHVSRVECGTVNVSIDLLARIAAALNVDIVELFGGAANDRASYVAIGAQDFDRIDEAWKVLDRLRRARDRRRA